MRANFCLLHLSPKSFARVASRPQHVVFNFGYRLSSSLLARILNSLPIELGLSLKGKPCVLLDAPVSKITCVGGRKVRKGVLDIGV